MGSENAKAVKQCVDDGKAIKKSYFFFTANNIL